MEDDSLAGAVRTSIVGIEHKKGFQNVKNMLLAQVRLSVL